MSARKHVAVGDKFHRWSVIGHAPSNKRGRAMYLCKCDCGVERAVLGVALWHGESKSCGCLKAEASSSRLTTHGKSHSPTYNAWQNMKHRCMNDSYERYDRYGGRGITICKEWMDSYEEFLKDMGEKPGPEFSLDRIDNEGAYEPKNCRWATKHQQSRNTSITTRLTLFGQTRPLTEWCDIFNIKANTVRSRFRYGWTVEESFSIPARSQ